MRPLKFVALAVFSLCSVMSWSQTVNLYSYAVPNGGYAPNGNLMNYSDLNTGTWSMQYDSLNRLRSASSTAGTYNGANIQWQYDSFGNRKAQTISGSSVDLPLTTTTQTMEYADGTNRITSSSIPGVDSSAFDVSGNLHSDGLNNISYDAEGHVCAVQNMDGTVTQYLYNAEGQRVAKGHPTSGAMTCPTPGDFVPTEKYILGLSGEQITQVDGSNVWQHSNVYANGQPIATYDQQGSQQLLHFQASDPLGSRRVQISSSGTAELSFSNLPYGDGFTLVGTGQDATQHHFTGKERDTESGLDYFGARYFGSSMGRFMSPDSMGGRPEDPQSWNLYSYVLNNPVTNTDPDGHDVQVCDNNGKCNTISNDAYKAAQQANNQGGLNAPTLDQVGNSKDANGNFTSLGITNSSGQQVGTAKYVPGDNPGIDPYVGNNMAGLRTLGAADKVVTAAAVTTGVVYAGIGAAATVPGAAAAVGRWGLQRLALGASSPALLNLINRLYQAQDEIPGGTAGAVRNEVMTGEFINGGHAIKASEMITAITKLINSGELSGSDQMIAGHIISDLKNSLGK